MAEQKHSAKEIASLSKEVAAKVMSEIKAAQPKGDFECTGAKFECTKEYNCTAPHRCHGSYIHS